ncbi:Transducin/WD40 repeat-like superfamily protein [Rhynchospora pubera]|uniref:Transducin/WD40 repeat-like superfamily protein n=1 Tax=Rhynchospora pubera TaxID=906938 RepID=A0AAV8E410_9POAL|nr:Transducin/WD40 repeat-like superfamily protein [Rhynchospora pubera]
MLCSSLDLFCHLWIVAGKSNGHHLTSDTVHATCLFFCLSWLLPSFLHSLSHERMFHSPSLVFFYLSLFLLPHLSTSRLSVPISSYPMALLPSSSSFHAHFPETRPDLHSIRTLISHVNHHLTHLLSDPIARNSLHQKFLAILSTSTSQSSDFSHHSVLSNLYYGIKSTEAATQCTSFEEKTSRLADAEKLLQVPALQQEEGTSAGIDNRLMVSLAYFYLALVKKLQGDQWQMTIHFLQSVSVHPQLLRTQLAPTLWECVFSACAHGHGAAREAGEEIDGAAKCQARRYKSWLMYYQVVSYGDAPPLNRNCNAGTSNHQCTSCTLTAIPSSFMPICLNNLDDNKSLITNHVRCDGQIGTVNNVMKETFDMKRLQEMLEDSQSDSPISHDGLSDASDSEDKGSLANVTPVDTVLLASKVSDRKCIALHSSTEDAMIFAPESARNSYSNSNSTNTKEEYSNNTSLYAPSCTSRNSNHNLDNSILDFRDLTYGSPPASPHDACKLRCFSNFSSKILHGSFARRIMSFSGSERDFGDCNSIYTHTEIAENFEKAILNMCSSNAGPEIVTVWEFISTQKELNCVSFKRDILDQLLYGISCSQKDNKTIRVLVHILLLMISEDKSVLQDIKRKKFYLHYLASALKQNIQEAVILIYLLEPSPSEIKNLDLLPTLVEIACHSSGGKWKLHTTTIPITPTSASIALIEILVTSFDYVTNNMHLARVSSPKILAQLVNVAITNETNLEEGVGLSAILVRCMRLNANCKKFLYQVTPVEPFLELLCRKERCAKSAALEYFQEILQVPRSSSNNLLQQLQQKGGLHLLQTLQSCLHESRLEHRLMAANLLLQLDLLGKASTKTMFREEAMAVLLDSVSSEENCGTQALAAHIISNLSGTHSWGGESYTAALLLKKAGLVSTSHRNMIRNVDWLEPCLQEPEASEWSLNNARAIIKFGRPLLNALSRGLQSKTKSVSRDCLVCAAWLGSSFSASTGPATSLREMACEVLLADVAGFLHPGSELDERILACFCVYNYTSGKGKQKLMSFSEGLRESLRRLSAVTWMAEELLRVTDYLFPTKPRVSCVHTQILEIGRGDNGAATAITFFKGQLYAGYADGTIKAWEIRGQRAMLVQEVREHKKSVICFSIFATGDNLLSGSVDKSIRVWRMVQRKIECVDVMRMKEPIQKLETFGDCIFVIMASRSLKMLYASRSSQTICKKKHIKSVAASQGKLYTGCTDFSIQELDVTTNNSIEIRAPDKSWKLRKQPVNSIVVYKDWMYCAGSSVQGSSFKNWRKRFGAHIVLPLPKGWEVQEMAVVEDFIYLNCNKNPSVIQIWLREKPQKVGRLVAGSKITCLLATNDTIFCATDTGLIQAWIPL